MHPCKPFGTKRIGIVTYPNNGNMNLIYSAPGTRMETSGSSVAPKMKAQPVRLAPKGKVAVEKANVVTTPADVATLRLQK